MTYSSNARRNLLATSADEPLLELIEITHAELDAPARYVNDMQDVVFQGNRFLATAFQITRPDDVAEQTPKAQISVDNLSRELVYWLEASRGGKGARCRYIVIARSEPDIAQFSITLDLTGLVIDNATVSGELGYQNTLALPATTKRFDPISSPGLF